MTLDEIEKLACDSASDDTGRIGEREWALARALLAVMPVVRAAEEWRDESCSRMPDCDPYEGTHDQHCEIMRNERSLCGAIDQMRAALGEEKQ